MFGGVCACSGACLGRVCACLGACVRVWGGLSALLLASGVGWTLGTFPPFVRSFVRSFVRTPRPTPRLLARSKYLLPADSEVHVRIIVADGVAADLEQWTTVDDGGQAVRVDGIPA